VKSYFQKIALPLLIMFSVGRKEISMFAKQYSAGNAKSVSEFEQFMEKFMGEHPEVVEDQRKGWYIFWDHKVDLNALKKATEDSVPVKGYYYS